MKRIADDEDGEGNERRDRIGGREEKKERKREKNKGRSINKKQVGGGKEE